MLTKEPKSVCGLFACDRCADFHSSLCPGCETGNERRRQESGTLCAVYMCAKSDGVESCRKCARPDCPPLSNLSEVCPLKTQPASGADKSLVDGVQVDVSLSLAKHLSNLLARRRHGQPPPPKIPERAIVRMRWYMRCLEEMGRDTAGWVSSATIGERTGVEAWLVRKDLSYFGEFGKPRKGYQVDKLLARLESIFQPRAAKRVALLGVNCNRISSPIKEALGEYNCEVVAVFDSDPGAQTSPVPGLTVLSLDRLPLEVASKAIDVCIVCADEEEVWDACDQAAEAGVRVILNMTPGRPALRSDVTVWDHSIHSDLFVVSYYAGGGSTPRHGQRAKQVTST